MMMIIAKREVQQIFQGFSAFFTLSILTFLGAWFFLVAVEFFILNQSALALRGFSIVVLNALANTSAWLFLILIPLLSMSVISAEYQQHSIGLLLSAPINSFQLVMGKYLGLLLFLMIPLMIIMLMPFSLGLLSIGFDWGLFFSVYIGMVLLLMLLSAIGLYFSSLNQQAFNAALASCILSLILWVLDSSVNIYHDDSIFLALSLSNHYQSLLSGQFNSGNIIYFILMSMLFLYLTMRQLYKRRLLNI